MADCGQHGIEQLRSAADEWLAGDVLIAAGRPLKPVSPIREPNGGEFESFWPPEGPTIPGRTGADTASISIRCVGIAFRTTKNGPPGSGPKSPEAATERRDLLAANLSHQGRPMSTISDDVEQLISRLAGPLSPRDRAAFRRAAEDAVARVPSGYWGEGAIFRALAPLQRSFRDPPSDRNAHWDIEHELRDTKLKSKPPIEYGGDRRHIRYRKHAR
jgi:hypothetical protein